MIFIYLINVHFDLTIILHYIKCRDQKDAAAITLQYTGFYIKKNIIYILNKVMHELFICISITKCFRNLIFNLKISVSFNFETCVRFILRYRHLLIE